MADGVADSGVTVCLTSNKSKSFTSDSADRIHCRAGPHAREDRARRCMSVTTVGSRVYRLISLT